MRWNKFTLKTRSEVEDIVISTLAEAGVEGVEIEDKVPLTEQDKQQMFVDILPDGPADDGIAYLNFYLDEKEDKEELVELITNEGLVRINLNKIYYFEYQSRKVLMKTNDKIYILKEKISDISSRMRSHGFEMPHKSFVVNLYNVKSIKGYDIFMMDESVIPLSQKKSTEFRKTLNIYLSNHIEKNIRG